MPASNGISTGAKIGIGIVVPLAVLAIALSMHFCCRRRRKPKATNSSEELIYPAYPQVQGGSRIYTAAEIEGSRVPELAVRTQAVESPDSAIKPELPSAHP